MKWNNDASGSQLLSFAITGVTFYIGLYFGMQYQEALDQPVYNYTFTLQPNLRNISIMHSTSTPIVATSTVNI